MKIDTLTKRISLALCTLCLPLSAFATCSQGNIASLCPTPNTIPLAVASVSYEKEAIVVECPFNMLEGSTCLLSNNAGLNFKNNSTQNTVILLELLENLKLSQSDSSCQNSTLTCVYQSSAQDNVVYNMTMTGTSESLQKSVQACSSQAATWYLPDGHRVCIVGNVNGPSADNKTTEKSAGASHAKN